MPIIEIRTFIRAPQQTVFDLSRSIDVHQESQTRHNERAIAGRTSGLIEQGEEVTWEATHLYVKQRLRVRITEMKKYSFFADEMISGAFSRFRHEHHFVYSEAKGGTDMYDRFDYTSPLGVFGILADKLFLESYMRRLLEERNAVIKELAERKALT